MRNVIEVLIATFIIVGLPTALFLEARRKRLGIGSRSYTWGYVLGTCGLIIATLVLLSFVITLFIVKDDELFTGAVGATALVVLYGVPGWYVIKRKRWAWVVLNYLTLNPVLWIIAYFYGRNRWNEFNAPAGSEAPIAAPSIG